MSYWVYVQKDGATCDSAWSHSDGGTYVVGGTAEMALNVTYNYGKLLAEVLPGGLRGLYGKEVKEALPLLKVGVEKLVGEPSENYWEACPGNARKVLERLVQWAQEAPAGAVFDVN